MYQGSTPSIPIRFEGVNLTEAKVYITVYDEMKKKQYDFESGKDFIVSIAGDDSVTDLSMSQEQTLALGTGLCSIQGRWVFSDGVAGTTQRASIQVQPAIKKEVISYGDN